MDAFNFQEFFDEIRHMEGNWKIAIQVLESRTFKALYAEDEDWNRFKSNIEELHWEERECNIIDFCQEVRDMVIQIRPKVQYTDFREKVQRKMKGTYGAIAVRLDRSFGYDTKVFKSFIYSENHNKKC